MGFETVVRPVVFPDIRPPPARALRIEDAPDKGLAVITGGSNSVVDLPLSISSSWTRNRMVEVRRKYDKVRIYYTRQDGTIDESQYWEFEVLRSIEFLVNGSTVWHMNYSRMEDADNLEIIQTGLTR